jgi:hypothetical protein
LRESQTAGEIIIPSKRIRLSWLTRDAPDRSAASPRGQCSPSTGFPARRIQCGLDVGRAAVHLRVVDRPVGFACGNVLGHRVDRVLFLDGAADIYLNARLVSPRIPEGGGIDLQRFHSEEGRKYFMAYTILGVVTVVANAVLGQAAGVSQWLAQNLVIAPMTIATGRGCDFH